METSPQELPKGELYAQRYKIDRLIGNGGMGQVYLAQDTLLADELVALKILLPQLSQDERYVKRFLREVQLTRKVTDPHVVRTFEVGEHNKQLFFTMEYVEGTTLAQFADKEPLPTAAVAQILLQICYGLSAIHAHDIIHRDLKPANIIVTNHGTLKIADFGVARPSVSTLTHNEEVIGSGPYMAPEIWAGRAVVPATDLYALGVLGYELLTGVWVFDADSAAELMFKHLEVDAVPPKSLCPDIPLWLNDFVLRLLKKDPAERYVSVTDAIAALELGINSPPDVIDQALQNLPGQEAGEDGLNDQIYDPYSAPAALVLPPEEPAFAASAAIVMPPKLEPLGAKILKVGCAGIFSGVVAIVTHTLAVAAATLRGADQHIVIFYLGLLLPTCALSILLSLPCGVLSVWRLSLLEGLETLKNATKQTFVVFAVLFLYFLIRIHFQAEMKSSVGDRARWNSLVEASEAVVVPAALLLPQGPSSVIAPRASMGARNANESAESYLVKSCYFWTVMLVLFFLSRVIFDEVLFTQAKSLRLQKAAFVLCGALVLYAEVSLRELAGQALSWNTYRLVELTIGHVTLTTSEYFVACGVLNWMLIVGLLAVNFICGSRRSAVLPLA